MASCEWPGRVLLASVFVHGGLATLADTGPRAKAAAPLLAGLRRRVPVPVTDETLVRANAIVHVTAGLALAAGLARPAAAGLLAVSLLPTTAAGHPFWRVPEPDRPMELIGFGKNLGLLGGLLLAARWPPPARNDW